MSDNLASQRLLTKRQLEILICAANGLTTAETAKELQISTETVKSHRRYILSRTRSRTITQALAKAIYYGLIDLKRV